MAFFSFVALGCTQVSPVLGGYLTDTYGWRTQFWILLAFWIVVLLLVIFACPETSFSRPLQFETDLALGDAAEGTPEARSESSDYQETEKGIARKQHESSNEVSRSPLPYYKQLLPLRRIYSGVGFFGAALHYFSTGLYPIVWYTFMVSNISIRFDPFAYSLMLLSNVG